MKELTNSELLPLLSHAKLLQYIELQVLPTSSLRRVYSQIHIQNLSQVSTALNYLLDCPNLKELHLRNAVYMADSLLYPLLIGTSSPRCLLNYFSEYYYLDHQKVQT